MEREIYNKYINLLRKELIPALGCTEPIAIAYCSAVAVKKLGCFPDRIIVGCSGNVIKNAKSVTVPNSNGQKGIAVAAILGAVAGEADRKLEVLASVDKKHIDELNRLKSSDFCKIEILNCKADLKISVKACHGDEYSLIEIQDGHTNIVHIEKNECIEYSCRNSCETIAVAMDEFLSVRGILEFAESVEISDVSEMIDRQIKCNMDISNEGLRNKYGTSVGKTLIETCGEGVAIRAKARAAAAADARMSGCNMPVVVNSGSGNQGLTVSLPVIEYANELNVSKEKLYRALVVSNLVSIHIKSKIGKLSAYCGAVSAACGSGAAITYLHGGSFTNICNTIINTLGNTSGIVCDGAKASCAAKVSSSVDAALIGHSMSMKGRVFDSGDGIIKNDIEETIRSVGKLAQDGMKETDVEILKIMLS
ncbi:L-cysteine desulfidase [Dethiosulfatibacter aminovorans DSM 17477]|uniref:UPF0597 protein SAMN02745751_02000 n=1 Tax=Dethiosulfatibacter aminovorans DSM 17477 TaxID=1121476 RepID=A0A1M6HFG6_9FIRM|nr:L-serine ammonia-lyase, iron-sulfur-dependent, subunit alpha [Dethiosulfatibacter aminovorans]SHJ20873.1 L-cysteine desulfidase [Dethiosulfatibacter aminovorans DSM 17477]